MIDVSLDSFSCAEIPWCKNKIKDHPEKNKYCKMLMDDVNSRHDETGKIYRVTDAINV
jgi:hypothetical protein